jgi:hypothetical protein
MNATNDLLRVFIMAYFLFPYGHHHYHQSINVPTAGAQAFLMDYS